MALPPGALCSIKLQALGNQRRAHFHPANPAHQHERFKGNIYNVPQQAELQRGLKAEAVLAVTASWKAAWIRSDTRPPVSSVFAADKTWACYSLCVTTARAALACWGGGRRYCVRIHLVSFPTNLFKADHAHCSSRCIPENSSSLPRS